METQWICGECGVELPGRAANGFCPDCLARVAWNSALRRLRAERFRKGGEAAIEAARTVLEDVDSGQISAELATWFELGHYRSDIRGWRLRMRLVELWVEELLERLKAADDEA